MAVTAASFKALFTEFSARPEAQVSQVITWAQSRISLEMLGNSYDEAVSWLAAHFLSKQSEAAFSQNGKASGPITEIDIDDEGSIKYSDRAFSFAVSRGTDYSSTVYGQHYLTLISSAIPSITII